MRPDRLELQKGFEDRLSHLGYELVQVEWAGHVRRPVIRLRVEHEPPDRPVSLDDCASVSRHMEAWLDREEALPDSYVLEVSSPGLERPLTRGRDFQRFRGRRVAVKGREELVGRSVHLEGELLGMVRGADGAEKVLLRLNGGDEVEVSRTNIEGARLIHDWKIR